MTVLIPPNHMMLYNTSQLRTGRRAAFPINELCAAFARVGPTIPNYRNIDVNTAVAPLFADKLKAVGAAAEATDLAQFIVANAELRDAYPPN